MTNSLSMPGISSKYKGADGQPASFLSGLWHGLLLPIFFLVSLFNDKVSIYETNNNGNWYHFGLVVGIYGFAGNTINITFGTALL
ncbi:hypothetical protein [Saliniradius amylolyticus]|uniref:hypothetical protein n=1 Tax=Saliniradius amylolyticus TaxID=2183582 RepID=UPI0013A595BA|nr:hypothetical protein [Saliniradius amylolyticus]